MAAAEPKTASLDKNLPKWISTVPFSVTGAILNAQQKKKKQAQSRGGRHAGMSDALELTLVPSSGALGTRFWVCVFFFVCVFIWSSFQPPHTFNLFKRFVQKKGEKILIYDDLMAVFCPLRVSE